MQHLLIQFARRPWLWLTLLLIATVIAASQVTKLRVKVSSDEMLVINDPQRAFYEEVKAAFGEEKIVLLVVEGERLLTPEQLTVLQRVINDLESLPFVARTESLFSAPHVKSVEGYLDKEPYLAKIPATAEEGQALLAEALKNPLIRNVLVSADGHAMAVAVVLKEKDREYDDDVVTNAIDKAVEPLLTVYERAYPIGFAQVRTEIASRIIEEQYKLMPLAVGALLLVLFVLMKWIFFLPSRPGERFSLIHPDRTESH